MMFPMQVNKYGKYSTLLFTGIVGSMFGHMIARSAFGDRQQHEYLSSNLDAILKGEKSLNWIAFHFKICGYTKAIN